MSTVAQMTTPHQPIPTGGGYGYGLRVLDIPGLGRSVEHGGGNKGVATHVAVLPERGITAVALTNLALMFRNGMKFTGLEADKNGRPQMLMLSYVDPRPYGAAVMLLPEVWAAELPRLEHLELWLGDGYYGGIATAAPLAPLLSGNLFPNLKYLGLRNSRIADEVAKAVAASPILERLEVLDLSLGNMGDEGARALIASPAVRHSRL